MCEVITRLSGCTAVYRDVYCVFMLLWPTVKLAPLATGPQKQRDAMMLELEMSKQGHRASVFEETRGGKFCFLCVCS